MKKLSLLFLTLIVSLATFAANSDNKKAITMVSYEQNWDDLFGTIALKNNTDKTVYNVQFQITYLDMAGNSMDYETFSEDVDIAPNMTKKIDLPAYEHNREYSYYKSQAEYINPHRFKIKFDLKSYSTTKSEAQSTCDENNEFHDSSESTAASVFSVFCSFLPINILVIIFGLYIGLYVLVAVMAKRRNRNAALWVLVSVVVPPIITLIILLCIGRNDQDNMNLS